MKQNTIGKKIRELRLQKGMTQAALAGDTVTRNMLSQIENGVAQPSVTTIIEIAERLEVPTEYFFSDCEDLNVFRKIGMIDGVRRAFAAKDYGRCIYRLDRLAVSDEETEYLYAESCFALGVAAYREGKLRLAQGHFERSLAHAEKTHYVGESFLCAVNRYLAASFVIRRASLGRSFPTRSANVLRISITSARFAATPVSASARIRFTADISPCVLA